MAFASQTTTSAARIVPKTLTVKLLTDTLVFLSHDAEAALEAAALNVNKAENDMVLSDFPHGKYGAEVILFVNVGSTTTQIYNYNSGLLVGVIKGGTTTWTSDSTENLKDLIVFSSILLPNTPTPWKGKWRPTSIVVVGAPGYMVPEGTTKWHAPATVPTPIAKWFSGLPEEFAVAVLNRTKAANIPQPNCDWGSAVASLTEAQTRALWTWAPIGVGTGLTFDIGGGYSRCYDDKGRKITEWDNYRSSEKGNDYLFPGGKFSIDRRVALPADIVVRATQMLRDYPENATGQVTPITLIATGVAREHYYNGLTAIEEVIAHQRALE
jgi:hypothetical protein